jgi:hypothetical protein
MKKVLSLYTGAGDLDLGLETAGFATVGCVEIDGDCRETLKRNRPSWTLGVPGDIHAHKPEDLLDSLGIGACELSVCSGGAPCQPWSKASYWLNGDAALKLGRVRVAGSSNLPSKTEGDPGTSPGRQFAGRSRRELAEFTPDGRCHPGHSESFRLGSLPLKRLYEQAAARGLGRSRTCLLSASTPRPGATGRISGAITASSSGGRRCMSAKQALNTPST